MLASLLKSLGRTRVIDDNRSYRGVELLVATLHATQAVKTRCDSKTLGVLLPTTGGFPISALAGWSAGKVVVPLNFLLKRDELQYVVEDCETDTIITAKPMLDFMGYAPKVKNLILLDQLDFKSLPELSWPADAQDEDLGVLLYTSGTSGKPKGVMLTHGNICANIAQCASWIDIDPGFTFLGVLPQFHSFGLTVMTGVPLTMGCKVVYTARFVPAKIYSLLRKHRPTVFVAIPSMYGALLHSKDATADDWSSVRYVVSGGEPLPAAVFEGFRQRFGVTINEGYGLTETSPCTNWCRPHEWRPHSVGMPLAGIDQRIVDPSTGRRLGPNHDGEVQMKGPNIMRGYFKLPEQTASVFTPDGYFKTGDMGRHDDDGHLYITGRIKEMMIVGGENVFPREIEEVLNQHPAIAASGVVGKMDALRGELPIAFVECKEGQSVEPREAIQFCRGKLAGYKVPSEVRVVEKLPRNPTGKIMRRELKGMV